MILPCYRLFLCAGVKIVAFNESNREGVMGLLAESTIELQVATTDNITEVLELHYRYQVDSIALEDKADGFITTAFTAEQLTDLIEKEQGLFIALQAGKVVAYAMAASWQFWSIWPMFVHMAKGLPELTYQGQQLSTESSYQYGPVCVDKSVRGAGVFEAIFEFSLQKMSNRYPILVTFINKINPRSYAAHVEKAGLEVIQEFEFNNNQYYELVCATASRMGLSGRRERNND